MTIGSNKKVIVRLNNDWGERVTEVVKYGNNCAVRAGKKWVVMKSRSYGGVSIMLSSP